MLIYRFTILISGIDYLPVSEETTDNKAIFVRDQWRKGDSFKIGGILYQHDNNTTVYAHNSVFAINEVERGQTVEDLVSFLEHYAPFFLQNGAEEITISIVVYISNTMRFLVLKKHEMERLLRSGNVVVSLDLHPMKETEIKRLQKQFIKEREKYENTKSKTYIC